MSEVMTDARALAALDEAIRVCDRNTVWMDELKAARNHFAALTAQQPVGVGDPVGFIEHSATEVSRFRFTETGMLMLGLGKHPVYATPPAAQAAGDAVQAIVDRLKDRIFPQHESPSESMAVWNVALYEMQNALRNDEQADDAAFEQAYKAHANMYDDDEQAAQVETVNGWCPKCGTDPCRRLPTQQPSTGEA